MVDKLSEWNAVRQARAWGSVVLVTVLVGWVSIKRR